MKPVIAVLWILSIALAVGLTRLADPDRADSEPSPSLDEAFSEYDPLRRAYLMSHSLQDFGPDDLPELLSVLVDSEDGDRGRMRCGCSCSRGRASTGPAHTSGRAKGRRSWRSTLTDQAMFAWAYHDGPAAMACRGRDRGSRAHGGLKQAGLEGWMRSDDKQGVAEYIANLPRHEAARPALLPARGRDRDEAEGREAAMRWVESSSRRRPQQFEGGPLQQRREIMWPTEDPVRAAEWYLEHARAPIAPRRLPGSRGGGCSITTARRPSSGCWR